MEIDLVANHINCVTYISNSVLKLFHRIAHLNSILKQVKTYKFVKFQQGNINTDEKVMVIFKQFRARQGYFNIKYELTLQFSLTKK